MHRRLLIALVAASCGAGGAALAHHGWGSYDASKVLTVDSTVTRVDWQNPHVQVAMNHEGASWEFVLAPPFRMEARGLNPDMIKVGTRVRAEGYPSTRSPREVRAERVSVGGKTFELR